MKNLDEEFEQEYENIMIELGKLTAATRKAKRLTQNQLAEKLGITREHLAKFESGKRRISMLLFIRIGKILETKTVL